MALGARDGRFCRRGGAIGVGDASCTFQSVLVTPPKMVSLAVGTFDAEVEWHLGVFFVLGVEFFEK